MRLIRFCNPVARGHAVAVKPCMRSVPCATCRHAHCREKRFTAARAPEFCFRPCRGLLAKVKISFRGQSNCVVCPGCLEATLPELLASFAHLRPVLYTNYIMLPWRYWTQTRRPSSSRSSASQTRCALYFGENQGGESIGC